MKRCSRCKKMKAKILKNSIPGILKEIGLKMLKDKYEKMLQDTKNWRYNLTGDKFYYKGRHVKLSANDKKKLFKRISNER